MHARRSKPMLAAMAMFSVLSACTGESPDMESRLSVVESAQSSGASTATSIAGAYLLSEPDVSFVLPDELREISGLTVMDDGRLGAIQDEEGVLYILNTRTGAVDQRYSFSGPDDYEGIERVDDRLFILRSNGTLIELRDAGGEVIHVTDHDTGLKRKNDTEGLAYDHSLQRLLIACKEEAGGELSKDQKAIYAFDLVSDTLVTEPAFVVDVNALNEDADRGKKFKPSGVALHPISRELYILSSTMNAIVVLKRDGTVRTVHDLPEGMFEQPEGIAFDDDATLYIASEGGKGSAMLYRFESKI